MNFYRRSVVHSLPKPRQMGASMIERLRVNAPCNCR